MAFVLLFIAGAIVVGVWLSVRNSRSVGGPVARNEPDAAGAGGPWIHGDSYRSHPHDTGSSSAESSSGDCGSGDSGGGDCGGGGDGGGGGGGD